jgi:23S rRNA (adenine2030-N6)-methyltransferase
MLFAVQPRTSQRRMNYRHAYHAGNFADVLKHVVLARVLTYMKQKPRPFRVIDTHAGSGRYDLLGEEPGKTGEWRDGIARLLDADLPKPVADLVAPYLDTVRAINSTGELRYYPGSPLIARQLMRPDDVLVANELHQEEFERLKGEFRRTKATTVLNLDAWHAVKSLLPPKERRGVVLIDPPFEDRDEFANLAAAVGEAGARFATGVFLIWYPLKDEVAADRFAAEVTSRSGLEFLDVRLSVCAPFAGLGLTASAVLVLNPPYVLRDELEAIMPVLAERLAEGDGSGYRLRDALQ